MTRGALLIFASQLRGSRAESGVRRRAYEQGDQAALAQTGATFEREDSCERGALEDAEKDFKA